MALSQRLDIRQGQSLVMTPQLQQAIKLLQMSNVELQEFVEQEIERNPLLERDEDGEAPSTEAPELSTDHKTPGDEDREGLDSSALMDAERGDDLTQDVRGPAISETVAGMPDSNWSSLQSSGSSSFDSDDAEFGATLVKTETLAEHLTDQLALVIADPAERLIGHHLIGMVNEAGYLTARPEDISQQLGADLDQVERVLCKLKTFDPTGVFACDLRECLALQLQEQDRYDPAMQALVDNLDLVAKRDFPALMVRCGVDIEDLRDMIAELKCLNPKPGNAFGSEPVQPMIPDVFVRAAPDGGWHVELNSDTLPRLLISNQYMSKVAGDGRTEDKTYVSECHGNATWLLKSLDQRAKTILKVAKEIVRQQDAFLVHGVKHLRPINLKTIADAIEMHESTVSRVTSNKYIATPRGTLEMKYFFTIAIPSAGGGESHSAEAVRQHIKDMVSGESASDILSDDAIVARLRDQGIDIARRTVSKYRESLNIPSSIQRRRMALAESN